MATLNGKITALYERLSRDDLLTNESLSIQNQKDTLEKYALDNGFANIKHFSDDGTSGTVFNRPGLNALIEEVKAGNVAVVIFKDQSRIGRDVLEVGLLKRTFEENNVRYIAAADGLDSANGFDIMSIFRDVFNEFYVADASKKARSSKRSSALQGKLISRPPFGYKCEDKINWTIDEEAAELIREIFKRYVGGETTSAIAKHFNDLKIPRPNDYYNTSKGRKVQNGYWHGSSIIHILDNSTYIGTYTAGRHTTPSYKNHKRITRPEDEWVIIENHHPAIIDKETFETVKRLRDGRVRKTARGDFGMLNGLLFCSDCGHKLNSVRNKKDYYICSKYRGQDEYVEIKCTRHSVARDEIEELVILKIRETIDIAISDKTAFAHQVNRLANKDAEKAIKIKTAEIGKSEHRVSELDKIINHIYEDHISGKLTEERFAKMLAGYEAEQANLTATIQTLIIEVEDLKSKTSNVQRFIKLAEMYSDVSELTQELARSFIEKIVVHEAIRESKYAGRWSPKTQEIHIFLSYIGEFIPEA